MRTEDGEEEEGEAGDMGSGWLGVCNLTAAPPALSAAQPHTWLLCGRGRGTSSDKAVTPGSVPPLSVGHPAIGLGQPQILCASWFPPALTPGRAQTSDSGYWATRTSSIFFRLFLMMDPSKFLLQL